MKKLVFMMSLLAAFVLNANPGYCTRCGCSRFDRDYLHEGSGWWCTCKHSWSDHNFPDRNGRSASFAGSVGKVDKTVAHAKESIAPFVVGAAFIVLLAAIIKNIL